jgi:hypothetical protein
MAIDSYIDLNHHVDFNINHLLANQNQKNNFFPR